MAQLSSQQQMLLCEAQRMHRAGRIHDALGIYRRLHAAAPGDSQLLFLLGTAQLQLGCAAEAIPLLQQALQVSPHLGGARSNLAVALQQAGRYDESLVVIDAAIEASATADKVAVTTAPLYLNRGNILRHLCRNEDALQAYTKAIALSPRYAEAFNNRGSLRREMGRAAEALPDYETALALNPRYSEASNNRGAALRDVGDIEGAAASFRQALAINPANAGAQWQLGTLELLCGDYANGWRNYQARWRSPLMKGSLRDFPGEPWLGDADVAGKTILIYAEQGMGDTIQFCRYAPLLAMRGASVVLEVQPPLVQLMRSLPGVHTVCQAGDTLPPFDMHCPMMSLPLAFGTRVNTIPAQLPYLAADPQHLAIWREHLGGTSRPRIGLCWSGRRGAVPDRWRNIPLEYLIPLLDLPCEFHALQKEIAPEDLSVVQALSRITLHAEEISDFADTAALIAQMDLVISVDTAVAHVAAASAVPVWIVTPQHPEWRWLMMRADSPWYPGARLFRPVGMDAVGGVGGDGSHGWQDVVRQIYQALSAYVAGLSV